jgi:hypothetical protein
MKRMPPDGVRANLFDGQAAVANRDESCLQLEVGAERAPSDGANAMVRIAIDAPMA